MSYNILILSMSTFPRGDIISESRFIWGDMKKEDSISYYSQLEPITRMLISEGNKPDDVLILCTKESVEPKEISTEYRGREEISPLEFYKERIGETELADGIRFIQCPEKPIDKASSEDKKNAVAEIARFVLNKKIELRKQGREKELKVWIDTQGSLRDISLLINAIFSLLKIADIVPSGIFYVDYNPKAQFGKIVSQNDIYQIFDFVSGINESILYGRTEQLLKYYDKIHEDPPEVIGTMKQLTDAIFLCDIEEFDKVLIVLREKIKNVDVKDPLFSLFIEQFKNDYGNLLNDTCSKLDVIEWLLKKKLYQQVLTYIESKIPDDWENRGILMFYIEKSDNTYVKIPDQGLHTKLLNSYMGRLIDSREVNQSKYYERVYEINEYDKLIYCSNNRNNKLGKDNYKKFYCKLEKEDYKKFNCDSIRYKVVTKAENKDALYREVILYKILKIERNLFNHMIESTGNGKKMPVEVLEEYIKLFIDNGRTLYSSVKK